MAKVLFKRKTTDEINELEVEDGALIYNTDNGKTYMDFGENRIQTGGNADTMIAIGGETPPTDEDIKIWIEERNNQNYNIFNYRSPENQMFEKLYLQPTGDTLPIGSITEYAGKNIPTNWLKCDGQRYLKTDYPELYEAIGNTYNLENDEGELYFRTPNFVERFPLGAGEDGEFDLGNTGGEKEHKLTIDEMPKHGHILKANIEEAGATLTGIQHVVNSRLAYNVTSENGMYPSGGDKPHNNMPPYITTNFIIKAKQSVGLVGNVTKDINDTNDNAVANAKTVKDYVDNKNIYSTKEQKIGTWVNGKTIYRKVFVGTFNDNSTLINNVDSLVNSYGTAIVNGAGYNKRTLGYYEYYGNLTYSFKVQQNTNNDVIVIVTKEGTSTTATGHIVLEYTKITDVEVN